MEEVTTTPGQMQARCRHLAQVLFVPDVAHRGERRLSRLGRIVAHRRLDAPDTSHHDGFI